MSTHEYTTCPSCQRKRNTLAVYTNNVKCHACGYYSREHELLGHNIPTAKLAGVNTMVQLPHIEPFEWTTKCIPSHVLDLYGVGMDNDGRVVSPHYSPDMQLLGYHTRTPGQRDFRMHGSNSPVGLHTLGGNKELIICEGHSDTYSAKTMFPGCDVIGIPGSDTVNTLLQYMSYIRKYNRITVMTDGDEAGTRCAVKLLDILPPAKTYTTTLDNGTDVGDYLVHGRQDDIRHAYKSAIKGPHSPFMGPLDVDKIISRGPIIAMPTGFTEFDEILGGGLAVGDMTVLTGYTGRGKSAFIGNVAVNMAKQGVKVMYVAGEMSPDQTTKRLTRQWFRTKLPVDIEEQRSMMYELTDNIYIDKSRDLSTAKVVDRIQSAVIDYDVRLVVIDVLSDIYSGDYNYLNNALTKLNVIAKGDFDEGIPPCHVLIVAHPKGEESGKVTADKLKGSSNIKQACVNVIGFNEAVEGDYRNTKRVLEVLKAGRNTDGVRGECTIDYDTYTQNYTQVTTHATQDSKNLRQFIRREVPSSVPSPTVSSSDSVPVGNSAQAGTVRTTDELATTSGTDESTDAASVTVSPGLLLPTDGHVHRDEGDTQVRGPDEVTTGSNDAPVNPVHVSSTDDTTQQHGGTTESTGVTQSGSENGELSALRRMYETTPRLLHKHRTTTYKTNDIVRANLVTLGYELL